ncbi:uncharacterized protein Tco025E_10128, partial [Trypanosoma conorhini]
HHARPCYWGKRDEVKAMQDWKHLRHVSVAKLCQKNENVLFFLQHVLQNGGVFALVGSSLEKFNTNVARIRGVVRHQRRIHAGVKSSGHSRLWRKKLASTSKSSLGCKNLRLGWLRCAGQRKQQQKQQHDKDKKARRRRRGSQAKVRTVTTLPPKHRHNCCPAIVLLYSL